MMVHMTQFSVRIVDDHAVEVKRGASKLRFTASLREHELYVDKRVASGPALDAAAVEAAVARAYEHLNTERGMKVDFVRGDGSHWGERQGWQARPVTPEEIAGANRGFWARLFNRQPRR